MPEAIVPHPRPAHALTEAIKLHLFECCSYWRTSGSIADAVGGRWDQVISILQTLVIDGEVVTRQIGPAVVYQILLDKEELSVRHALSSHPPGYTRAELGDIRGRIPESRLDEILQQLAQDGTVRLVDDRYRMEQAVPLEGPARRRGK